MRVALQQQLQDVQRSRRSKLPECISLDADISGVGLLQQQTIACSLRAEHPSTALLLPVGQQQQRSVRAADAGKPAAMTSKEQQQQSPPPTL